MKKLVKLMLLTIPALAVAAAVGFTTVGCGDDNGMNDMATTVRDMAMPVRDMAMPPGDMAKKGD